MQSMQSKNIEPVVLHTLHGLHGSIIIYGVGFSQYFQPLALPYKRSVIWKIQNRSRLPRRQEIGCLCFLVVNQSSQFLNLSI